MHRTGGREGGAQGRANGGAGAGAEIRELGIGREGVDNDEGMRGKEEILEVQNKK